MKNLLLTMIALVLVSGSFCGKVQAKQANPMVWEAELQVLEAIPNYEANGLVPHESLSSYKIYGSNIDSRRTDQCLNQSDLLCDGAIGYLDSHVFAVSGIGQTDLILRNYYIGTLWLKDYPTKGVVQVSGKIELCVQLMGLVKVDGTTKWKVNGEEQTIPVVRPLNRNDILKIQLAAEEALYRTWTDSTGTKKIVAKFLDSGNSKVSLERKDDHRTVVLPVSQLSKEDQQWVCIALLKKASIYLQVVHPDGYMGGVVLRRKDNHDIVQIDFSKLGKEDQQWVRYEILKLQEDKKQEEKQELQKKMKMQEDKKQKYEQELQKRRQERKQEQEQASQSNH